MSRCALCALAWTHAHVRARVCATSGESAGLVGAWAVPPCVYGAHARACVASVRAWTRASARHVRAGAGAGASARVGVRRFLAV